MGLVTGARVKIGFQAALKMLRAGARVIATTRFPHDAALRYAREADFAEWQDRLQVHGLDLRHAPSVEIFARYVEHTYERLDILINNAARRCGGRRLLRAPAGERGEPGRGLPRGAAVLAATRRCKAALQTGQRCASALDRR